jgi:phage terminase large subunit-like protein
MRSTSETSSTHGDALHVDDDDPGALVVILLGQVEALAQVHDGNDLAAKVDDALHEVGRARHAGDVEQADDLLHGEDVDAEDLLSDGEGDQLDERLVRFRLAVVFHA